MAKSGKKPALGRGLSALLQDPDNDIKSAEDKNGQKNRFADFVILASACATMNHLRALIRKLCHLILRHSANKKPPSTRSSERGAFILTF